MSIFLAYSHRVWLNCLFSTFLWTFREKTLQIVLSSRVFIFFSQFQPCFPRPLPTLSVRLTRREASSTCPAWMTLPSCFRWLWWSNVSVSGSGRGPNTDRQISSSTICCWAKRGLRLVCKVLLTVCVYFLTLKVQYNVAQVIVRSPDISYWFVWSDWGFFWGGFYSIQPSPDLEMCAQTLFSSVLIFLFILLLDAWSFLTKKKGKERAKHMQSYSLVSDN